MIPFGVVMLDVFAQRPPQGALAKENDLRQTLVVCTENADVMVVKSAEQGG